MNVIFLSKTLILEDFLKTCEKIATAFHIAKAKFLKIKIILNTFNCMTGSLTDKKFFNKIWVHKNRQPMNKQ